MHVRNKSARKKKPLHMANLSNKYKTRRNDIALDWPLRPRQGKVIAVFFLLLRSLNELSVVLWTQWARLSTQKNDTTKACHVLKFMRMSPLYVSFPPLPMAIHEQPFKSTTLPLNLIDLQPLSRACGKKCERLESPQKMQQFFYCKVFPTQVFVGLTPPQKR